MRTASWVALCVLFCSSWLEAGQILTGRVIGIVIDATGTPVRDASVRIERTSKSPFATTTDDRGRFRFPTVDPDVYVLTVEKAAFQSHVESDVVVAVGTTVERTVSLELEGITEEIGVSGRQTGLDAYETGVTTRYSREFIEAIPKLRFSIFDFTKTAPGLSADRPTGVRNSQVSALGSSTDENMYLLDGTDMRSPFSGRAWPWPDPDVVQEVEILSIGASAEYADAPGAVFNVITKGGGNAFRGDAAYFGQFDALTSHPISVPCNCPEGETTYRRELYRDLSAHAGGPLVSDRAWLYGGYQYQRDVFAFPGSEPSQLSELSTDRVFVKANWRLGEHLTFLHSFHEDFWAVPETPVPGDAITTRLRFTGHSPTITFADVTHTLGQNTFYNARVSGMFAPDDRAQPVVETGESPRYDGATGSRSGGPPFTGGFRQARISVRGKLSHYAQDFLASDHDFKFGAQYESGAHDGHYGYTNDTYYYDYAGEPYYAYFRERYDYAGGFTHAGVFAEDVLRAGDRVTLQFGLRFDRFVAKSPTVERLSEDFDVLGQVEGHGTFYTWNNWSPRIGFNLALDSSGRTALRGTWGRYYRGVLTHELDLNHPGRTPITGAFFDPATGGYTDVVSVTRPGRDFFVDDELRSPRTDQLSLGLDREIAKDLSVGVSYVHKRGRDYPAWQVLNAEFGTDVVELASGATLEVFPIRTDPSERQWNMTTRPELFLDYDGLLLVLDKRWNDRWQLKASYTLSRAEGLGVRSGQFVLLAQSSGVRLNSIGIDPNDFTNRTGRLLGERPHMLRIQGSARIVADILLAASYQLLSGKPWAAETRIRLPQGIRRVLVETPGSQRLPMQNILDVRVSRVFRFGTDGKLEILIDILNALDDSSEQAVRSQNIDAPAFGEPALWNDPRRAMIGVKLGF